MDFNLKMLNLWIGLCKGDPLLPPGFHSLGYQQHAIEQTIRNSDGTTCVPELIAFSKRTGHTIAFEWKSGNNTEPDQLSRYSKLTAKAIIENALVHRDAARNFDVAIVCEAERVERIRIGVEAGRYKFPILAVSDDGVALVANCFSCQPLNELLTPKLPIDMRVCPVGHVPLSGTSEDWEVADRVIPVIVEKMLKRLTVVKVTSLCMQLFPFWDNMAAVAKGEAERRVCAVLEQACIAEFQPFLNYRKRNNACEIDIANNPLAAHGMKRGGGYKRLLSAQAALKARLAAGKRFQPDGELPFS